ncbi:hypothetical protein GMLC_06280 [Geomonas limicola]|uniref:DUF3618 domain-containing protein n=1 Tax=Geomonas limicola TaxID=2740186 RepID=A0A6V8N6Z3_9BACT|nr:DUF3618 domain-containing protein [Geomonas limicola]GFO67049.1 hypothetical protein GMLC_06280 [Geomonas limicola]
MGENTKELQSAADTLREQIRHTESDIAETVQDLEARLSPRGFGRRGLHKAGELFWQGTARLLTVAQRTPVQASLVGGSALWLVLRSRKRHSTYATPLQNQHPEQHANHKAAKMAGATGGLLMLLRKAREREVRPPVSGLLLALTASKAFLSGARSSKKSGTTQPGRKIAWRALATALGAALGSYWYSHRGQRA